MRYNFDNMDADSFELMIRSLNMKIFGVKCDQYGLGPDGQREFVFSGEIMDMAGNVFKGRTIGQVKYKYPVTREGDYHWLIKEIEGELERFRMKEPEFIPDNYLFYTNVLWLVLLVLGSTGFPKKLVQRLSAWLDGIGRARMLTVCQNVFYVAVFLVSVAYLVDATYNPFLYFRF